MKSHRYAIKKWKTTLYLCSVLLLTFSSPAWAICQANGKTCGNQGVPSNDRLCCPGSICGWGNVCNPGCRINGIVYQAGTLNAANRCQVCLPYTSTTRWSNVSNGAACGDRSSSACDRPDTCSNGSCRSNRLPAGTPCRPVANLCDAPETCDGSGASCPLDIAVACPASACETPGTCDLSNGVCSPPTPVDDFTPCPDDGNLCTADERCIEGICQATAELACSVPEVCDPATGQCAPAP